MKFILFVLIGLLGGLVATGPMSLTMILGHRRLLKADRYSLPPREITDQLISRISPAPLRFETVALLTLINHFAYGSGAGAVYSLWENRSFAPAWLKGLVYGAAVWGLSYFALLPKLGLLKSAHQHPANRNVLMFVAHLIWGMVMSTFVYQVKRELNQPVGALIAPTPKAARDQK